MSLTGRATWNVFQIHLIHFYTGLYPPGKEHLEADWSNLFTPKVDLLDFSEQRMNIFSTRKRLLLDSDQSYAHSRFLYLFFCGF